MCLLNLRLHAFSSLRVESHDSPTLRSGIWAAVLRVPAILTPTGIDVFSTGSLKGSIVYEQIPSVKKNENKKRQTHTKPQLCGFTYCPQ